MGGVARGGRGALYAQRGALAVGGARVCVRRGGAVVTPTARCSRLQLGVGA